MSTKTKKILLGMTLGLAVALFFNGLVAVNSSSWMFYFLIIPPLVGVVGGLIVGWLGFVPSIPWYATLVIALLLCPTALFGPIKVQEWRFKSFAENLPAYNDAKREIKSLDVHGGDSPPYISVEFRKRNIAAAEMVDFYRNHFSEAGWRELEPRVAAQSTYYRFRKGNYDLDIVSYENRYGAICVRIMRHYNTLFFKYG